MSDLEEARRLYVQELRPFCAHGSETVLRAFGTVPRERFLGPPPWRVHPEPFGRTQPSIELDPAALYHNVLVAIDPARHLNNGAPSLWAAVFDGLEIRPGERAVHIGCGTGYYSAILAEIVGARGSVQAVEVDPGLAARSRENLVPWERVEVVCGDGTRLPMAPADVVIVNAGATHLVDPWLDQLADGGRLFVL